MFWSRLKKKKEAELLISKEYSALLTEKHNTDHDWGSSGVKFFDRVQGIIKDYNPQTILDYGCGKAALSIMISEKQPVPLISLYDPGIPQLSNLPDPADFVICTDVLEHIEPEKLDNVLSHIRDLTKKVAYFVVFTGDCGHKLPDGRPCHLIQESMFWWIKNMIEIFNGFDIKYNETGLPYRFEVVLSRREVAMTDEEALECASKIRKNLEEIAAQPDPQPQAIPKGNGMLGSFGGALRTSGEKG